MNDLKFDAKVVADGLAVGRPGVGRSLQAVVDMDGAQRGGSVVAGVSGQQVQEDGGVEATGEGYAPGGGLQPGGEVDHEGLTWLEIAGGALPPFRRKPGSHSEPGGSLTCRRMGRRPAPVVCQRP